MRECEIFNIWKGVKCFQILMEDQQFHRECNMSYERIDSQNITEHARTQYCFKFLIALINFVKLEVET